MCCGGVGRPALWGVGVGAGPLASIVVVTAEKRRSRLYCQGIRDIEGHTRPSLEDLDAFRDGGLCFEFGAYFGLFGGPTQNFREFLATRIFKIFRFFLHIYF